MFSVSSLYLGEKYREFEDVAKRTYFGLCILKDGESWFHYQQQLYEETKKIFETYQSRNYKKSKEACIKELQTYLQNFNGQFADRYSKPEGTGLQNLCDDIKEMKAKYNKKELGPAKEKVFTKFENNEVS
jgi:hypothetical protein